MKTIDDLECESCKSSFNLYSLKQGKNHEIICKDCLGEMLIEECNEAYEIDNLDEEDQEEILKEINEETN